MSDWKYDPDASTSALLEWSRNELYEMGEFPSHFYAKEKKMKRSGSIRRAIGIILIVAALAIIVAMVILEKDGWKDCILPSVLFGVGLAFCRSYPYVSTKYAKVYVDGEDVAKGLFGGAIGMFIVLVILFYTGII